MATAHWTEDLFLRHPDVFLAVHEHAWSTGEEQARDLHAIFGRFGVPPTAESSTPPAASDDMRPVSRRSATRPWALTCPRHSSRGQSNSPIVRAWPVERRFASEIFAVSRKA